MRPLFVEKALYFLKPKCWFNLCGGYTDCPITEQITMSGQRRLHGRFGIEIARACESVHLG